MRMKTEDIVLAGIEVDSFDERNWKIVSEVLPYYPFSEEHDSPPSTIRSPIIPYIPAKISQTDPVIIGEEQVDHEKEAGKSEEQK